MKIEEKVQLEKKLKIEEKIESMSHRDTIEALISCFLISTFFFIHKFEKQQKSVRHVSLTCTKLSKGKKT